MLNPIPVADSAHGIVTQPPHSPACSGVIGASEAPKSTVRAPICLIPSPDPTGLYFTGVPVLLSNPVIQFDINGATRVDPAPFSVAEANAGTASAIAPTSPSARPINFLRVKACPFDRRRRLRTEAISQSPETRSLGLRLCCEHVKSR